MKFLGNYDKYYIGTIVTRKQTEYGEDMTTSLLLLREIVNYKSFTRMDEPVFVYKDVITNKIYEMSDFNEILPYSKLNDKKAQNILNLYIEEVSNTKEEKQKIKLLKTLKKISHEMRK